VAGAERVLCYLRGTHDRGLEYCDPGIKRLHVLEGWVDLEFASCPDTWRSTSGYVLSLNGAPVSWKAKRQVSVTSSSAEAEFVAASLCWKEVVYLRAVLRGMGQEQALPTILWEDNQPGLH